MAQALGVVINPWTQRRRRSMELAERWPFATELLTFYAALLDVQEAAWAKARIDAPARADVASYAETHVLRHIVDVTTAKGPAKLAATVAEAFHEFDFVRQAHAWLANDVLEPVHRYLVRASVGPVLEAIGIAADRASSGAHDERYCPQCGGLPQLSYLSTSAEELVTPQRFLECERCATSWTYPRMTCAACGETKTDLLPIFAEQGTLQAELAGRVIRKHGSSQTDGNPEQTSAQGAPRFRHLRIDACRACAHYLLTVDLGREPQAVPVVDELAAVPLDLYAKELGMTKIVPNLMGF
ncbi:MAG: formate dehydrogenase accessory protein FdhE [Candidatus Eremiobacteraeota bacterium]|nr:formate dehydrogenase accessory protein FdhE [Candidatus Eremiobacteraeota bacterium]